MATQRHTYAIILENENRDPQGEIQTPKKGNNDDTELHETSYCGVILEKDS